jgi:hypothetical protein
MNDRDPEVDVPDVEPDLVESRAESLLPEELQAGSDDPHAQAQALLEESEERTLDGAAAPGTSIEHRTSDDTVDRT